MNKIERITAKVSQDKEIQKRLKNHPHSDTSDFIRNAERYIKAIKEGRVICSIPSVSRSGMSRQIKFLECSKGKTQYNYYNFWLLFKLLGFTEARGNRDAFTISGCGMDMVFHTNYTIIHKLQRLGFISRKQCDHLAQQTPTVI